MDATRLAGRVGTVIRAAILLAAPVAPDRDEARRWAERELADRAYEEAEPTLLDVLARAIADFFADLFSGDAPPGLGLGFAVITTVIVLALVVVAVLIWGRPRSVARSRAAVADPFGEPDGKTAQQLRVEAEAHAGRGAWDDAIVLRFRALARSLAERGVVEVTPGATVHAFARRAVAAFPAEGARVDAAADAFDDVRYLRRPGSAELYRAIARLDDDLSRTRPLLAEAPV